MKTTCSKGDRYIFGFLAGDVRKAIAAVEHLATCDACKELLEAHARLEDAAALHREQPPCDEDACDPLTLAELTPAQARQNPHLRSCASCRMEWLLAQSAFPSPAPTGLAQRIEGALRTVFDGLADAMNPRVLVPVGAMAAVAVIALLAGQRGFFQRDFPYDTWTMSQKEVIEIARHRHEDPDRGFGFSGPGDRPPVAYQYGFVAGAVRDLLAQARADVATEVVTAVLARGGVYDELGGRLIDDVRAKREPCKALASDSEHEACRTGLVSYGVVRDFTVGGSAPVPRGLPDLVHALAVKYLKDKAPSRQDILDRKILVQTAQALFGL